MIEQSPIGSTWREMPACEFCDSVRDGTHDSPKFLSDGFPLVTSKHIKKGIILTDEASLISRTDFEQINRRSKVDTWDVLITMIGTVGDVALVRDDPPQFAIKNVGLLKTKSELDGRWLYYWLSSPQAKGLIFQRLAGASQQYLTLGHLRSFPVRTPVVEETKTRIVDTLRLYDDLIENNRRRIKLLDEAARLIYREWFVRLRFPGHDLSKIENGLPEGWKRGTISDFYSTTSGGTPSRAVADYYGGEICWVKTQELQGGFIFDTEEHITQIALRRSSAKLLPEGTLLVAMYGATIGKTGLLAVPAACNQACAALLPRNKNVSTIYAHLFFSSIGDQLMSLSQGAAQRNISQQIIQAVPITLPSERIAELFESIVRPIYEQRKVLEQMQPRLARARDLLLPRLMSGEIEV